LTRTLRCLWLGLWALLAGRAAGATEHAAAFLQPGIGSRGPGLGTAYAAVVGGPDAVCWNPAGLARTVGLGLGASLLPLSADRRHSSLAAALNRRGEMAFGVAWVHAGTGDLQARTGSGTATGAIDDSENAFFVAVAAGPTTSLRVGLALKVIDQRLQVPGWRRAEARGHGLDAGVQGSVSDWLELGAAVRNLHGSVEWKVERSAAQATSTTDRLQRALLVGAGIRWPAGCLLTVEVAHAADPQASFGVEWVANDLATLRAGVQGLPGDEATPQAVSAGLSLRPMRNEALLFHYAFVTDRLGAGDRAVFGLSSSF